MDISLNTTPQTEAAALLLGQRRDIATMNGETESADETELNGSPFTVQKELTPEEQRRVEFLQNLLTQTLAMAEGNPTDEQKTRIREIENELEKITGVKAQSRLSTMTAKLPGKTDGKKKKQEEREREEDYQLQGIDPKEAVHNNRSLTARGDNPGMQMLRQNALFTAIGSLDLTSSLSTGFSSGR